MKQQHTKQPKTKADKGSDVVTMDRQRVIFRNTNGLYNFAPIPADSYFSKLACETCGDKLYGQRQDFSATVGKKHTCDRVVIACCTECYVHLFT